MDEIVPTEMGKLDLHSKPQQYVHNVHNYSYMLRLVMRWSSYEEYTKFMPCMKVYSNANLIKMNLSQQEKHVLHWEASVLPNVWRNNMIEEQPLCLPNHRVIYQYSLGIDCRWYHISPCWVVFICIVYYFFVVKPVLRIAYNSPSIKKSRQADFRIIMLWSPFYNWRVICQKQISTARTCKSIP